MADAPQWAKHYRRDMSSAATTMITLARRSQEWLRSRPRLVDVLVAGLMALLALADLSGDVVADSTRDPDAVGVLLVLIAATALVGRRTAPIAVMVFVIAVSCVCYARDYGSFMAPVGLATLYAVTAHERNRRTAWIALSAGSAVLFGVASFTLLDGVDGYRWSSALGMILSMGRRSSPARSSGTRKRSSPTPRSEPSEPKPTVRPKPSGPSSRSGCGSRECTMSSPTV